MTWPSFFMIIMTYLLSSIGAGHFTRRFCSYLNVSITFLTLIRESCCPFKSTRLGSDEYATATATNYCLCTQTAYHRLKQWIKNALPLVFFVEKRGKIAVVCLIVYQTKNVLWKAQNHHETL